MALTDAPVVAIDEFDWLRPPGGDRVHAFGNAPWARSVCREEPWTIHLDKAEESDTRCHSCLMLLGFGE